MSYVLAEGGYQAFDLSGTDTTVLLVSLLVALGALGVAFVMMQGVLKADDGTPAMTGDRRRHPGGRAWPTSSASSAPSA